MRDNALGACSPDCPAAATPADCAASWCPADQVPDPADVSACVAAGECQVNTDCPDGERCDGHDCVPDTPGCSPDASEEDDTFRQATDLAVPGQRSLNFCDDAADWFRFDATEGDRLDFETSGLTEGTDTVLDLLGPDGAQVLANNDDVAEGNTASLIAAWHVPASGSYFLRVTTYSGESGPTWEYVLEARAAVLTGDCFPGQARCAGDASEICDASGHWGPGAVCPDCRDDGQGPVCQGGATRVVSSRLNYEARSPNADWTDWGEVFVSPISNMLVVSYSAAGETVDSTLTGGDGDFSLQVPDPSQEGDVVAFFPLVLDADGAAVFAVAEPAVGDGEQDVMLSDAAQADASYQYTYVDSALLDAEPEDFTLPADAAGWMRVFDYGRYVYLQLQALTGWPGQSLVIWMRPNTTWSCGECQGAFPGSVGGDEYQSQMWIPMTAEDESYWSDAATAHELGHWVMGSYGFPAVEGGMHFAAVATFPGQAWSEGFATWTSSVVRSFPLYYDKQGGGFFWADLDSHGYSDGGAFVAPDPGSPDGPLQLMDENEVAAELWALSSAAREDMNQAPSLTNGHLPFINALASSAMTDGPFGWGYTRHTWEYDPTYTVVNVVDTGEPAPAYPDYLDALACQGVVRAQDMVPALNGLPYDPHHPNCR